MKNSIDYSVIGRRIRDKRKKLCITQDDMSDAIGITKHYISKIENGKVKPTLETLSEIGDYLEMDLSTLITGVSPYENRYLIDEYVELFKSASPDQKNTIISIMKYIVK